MNRRNLFKSLLALPLISCVGQKPKSVYKYPDDFTTYDFSEIDEPILERRKLAPRDTDGIEYDQWLEEYGKDEMHL